MKKLTLTSIIIIIFSSQISCILSSIDEISFKDGGYSSVTIAISENVKENQQILTNLKEILQKSSKALWTATKGRAYFRDFNIIIPQNWRDDPIYQDIDFCFADADIKVDNARDPDDEPYTEQKGDCGEPGEYTFLPTNFIMDDFKNKEKIFVHEWAHLRYGVFEEHGIPGDPNFPPGVLEDDGNVTPSVCRLLGEKDYSFEGPGDTSECEYNLRMQIVDPECSLYPKDGVVMKSSLMFDPSLDEIDGFCSDTNDEDYKHNVNARTMQNLKCNLSSIMDIIISHEDFRNPTSADIEPVFNPKVNLMKISNANDNGIYVFLFDVSGSMSGTKIKVLSSATKEFISTYAQIGMKLGLVRFDTSAIILHEIVEINDQTRQTLVDLVPNYTLGSTSIGDGLNKSLDAIDRYGTYTKATIILMSDGGENESPMIKDVIQRIKSNSKLKINTIALGTDAPDVLENLASETKGDGASYPLVDVDDINAVSQTVAASIHNMITISCYTKIQKVQITNDFISIVKDYTKRSVFIDQELGKNTIFIIATKDLNKLKITFKSPESKEYNIGSDGYEISDSKVQLSIDQTNGKWDIIFYKNANLKNPDIQASIQVTSELNPNMIDMTSMNSTSQPVILESSISDSLVDPSKPPKIFAILKKGYDPVLLASVSATVETPNGNNVKIQLYDNGIGADSVRNDGIYTAYFTEYELYGQYKRYNVLVSAINDGNAKLKSGPARKYKYLFQKRNKKTIGSQKTNSIDNFKQVLFFSKRNDNFKPVNEFSRVQNAGAFRLINNPTLDKIPPNRVTDFSIASVDEYSQTVDLQWTSAGDDLTTGTAKQLIIRADYDLNKLRSDDEFDKLFQFTEIQVVSGSLNPMKGGVKHLIKLSVENFWLDKKFSLHFALRNIDESNNISPISNTVSVIFGVLKKVEFLYQSTATLTEQSISRKLNIDIINSTTSGLFTIDINAEDLINLDVYFRSPDKKVISENSAGFVRDNINGQIHLNYEKSLFGNWILYIQRINIKNPRDVNIYVNAIAN